MNMVIRMLQPSSGNRMPRVLLHWEPYDIRRLRLTAYHLPFGKVSHRSAAHVLMALYVTSPTSAHLMEEIPLFLLAVQISALGGLGIALLVEVGLPPHMIARLWCRL